jgi:enoyl-CoA hydratase
VCMRWSMRAQETKDGAADDILVERHGAAGVVALNRPQALNALTTAMRATIAAAFPRHARDPQIYAVVLKSASPKAFCAGGDIREITRWAREQPAEARRSLAEEYALSWLLECFSKPTVSLIDGMVMGSGVGISLYGTHRVAGERYAFAMPETVIGLFPDDGVASAFARLPGETGMYLGLTGRSIGRADAHRLGLATHCIPAARFAEIEAGLASADPVDPLLDGLHQDPGGGELDAHRDVIDRCFAGESVEDIVARLETEYRRGTAAASWCAGVLADLATRSPTSLKVTFRHIREARARDLRQTLMLDYRLACRFLDGHDFLEGVRAALIDKDRRPRWRPDRLEDVSDVIVECQFAPMPSGELILPTRQEVQATRV